MVQTKYLSMADEVGQYATAPAQAGSNVVAAPLAAEV